MLKMLLLFAFYIVTSESGKILIFNWIFKLIVLKLFKKVTKNSFFGELKKYLMIDFKNFFYYLILFR